MSKASTIETADKLDNIDESTIFIKTRYFLISYDFTVYTLRMDQSFSATKKQPMIYDKVHYPKYLFILSILLLLFVPYSFMYLISWRIDVNRFEALFISGFKPYLQISLFIASLIYALISIHVVFEHGFEIVDENLSNVLNTIFNMVWKCILFSIKYVLVPTFVYSVFFY